MTPAQLKAFAHAAPGTESAPFVGRRCRARSRRHHAAVHVPSLVTEASAYVRDHPSQRDRRAAIDLHLVDSHESGIRSARREMTSHCTVESTIFSTDMRAAGGDCSDLTNTIGWAVSTWYRPPAHIEGMRRRAMAQDHSWDRSAREYVDLYLTAYACRRGHPFVGTEPGDGRMHVPLADKPAPRPIRVAIERPFERLPLPTRHARAPVVRQRT